MNQENITRTLATGLSDITRHEAFTKAQGLNWANANVPKYTNNTGSYEYVDLGLPSGTLWAKCNIGASSETDGGLYFAWGETQGYTAEQVGVDKQFALALGDYKFDPSGDGLTFTKYNQTDNKIVLDAEDDAATVNMGGEWHMPTKAQYEELLNTQYVTNEWVENYNDSGVNGCLFTSVSNGNTIFIPATGVCSDSEVLDVGRWGNIWASSFNADNADDVFYAGFFSFSSRRREVADDTRYHGQSVRGVIGE